jgi:hypothetical protein
MAGEGPVLEEGQPRYNVMAGGTLVMATAPQTWRA